MNRIHRLVAEIVTAALEVNQAGLWHVFVDVAGHTHALYVRICPSSTDYQDKDRPTPEMLAAYLDPEFYNWLPADERESCVIESLNRQLAHIRKHLPQENAA